MDKELGTTLKLRLSLMITGLLAVVTLAGGAYVVSKARDDISAETASTLTLTRHFLRAQVNDIENEWRANGFAEPHFELHDLGDVRHLTVEFRDARGVLLESNVDPANLRVAPAWFGSLIRAVSTLPGAERLAVLYQDNLIGQLIIAPDPQYETDEMWSTCRGLLGLLLSFLVLVNALVWWAATRAMRPVERILFALSELRSGNLAARLPNFGVPELSRISVGFNHMAETLERSVTENQRLTRRLLETQENERTSIARELHDEIGQCISAIHADASAIRNRGGAEVQESAEAISDVTTHIKQIVRSMLQRLRPPILEDLGLGAALRDLAGGFQQRNPQIHCELLCSGPLERLDPPVAVAIYRVIQECLSNVSVHAHARSARIEVTLEDARMLRATVVDDGIGFFLLSVNRGLGLTGIKERVQGLGGECLIETHPGHGTRIDVRVPFKQNVELPA